MRIARSCGAGGIGKARLLKLTNGRRLLLGGAQIQRLLPRSFAAFPHVPVVLDSSKLQGVFFACNYMHIA